MCIRDRWGRDNMDELSLGAGTLVGELRDGVVREYELHPEDFGIAMAHSRNLKAVSYTHLDVYKRQMLRQEPP